MTPTEFAATCREVTNALRERGFTRETAERLLPTYFLLPKDQPHADSRPADNQVCTECGNNGSHYTGCSKAREVECRLCGNPINLCSGHQDDQGPGGT